jgi:putative transposase
MVERMQGMSALEKRVAKTSLGPGDVERAAIREMVKSAKDRGLALTGPDGLLKILTKTVLETALDEEMNDHLGYAKHASEGRNGENSRNGLRAKTVITDTVGPVEIAVPRDRDASFDPQIVKKRQRRLGDVDTIVLSLYARGLTTGEISAHVAEIYGASVSKDVVSTITDRVLEEMAEWASRPLAWHYVAVFVDAIHVKVRDGQVAGRWPTARSTRPSAWTCKVAGTSWACGPARPAPGSPPSSGWAS